jgi:ABC-type multidrug transport system permease subunit
VSKRFAEFIYKYFTVLSWIFTVAFFASMLFTVVALYNFVATGNCEPGSPASTCTLGQASSFFGLNVSSPISRLFVVIGAIIALIVLVLAVALLIKVLSRSK